MILNTDGIKAAKTNRSFHLWKYKTGSTRRIASAGTIPTEVAQRRRSGWGCFAPIASKHFGTAGKHFHLG